MADIPSPFAGINLERLDRDFLALLRQATEPTTAGAGLTARERCLFRFGLLTGLGEWAQAGEELGRLIDDGLLAGPEAERAAAEAGLVKGWPACRHLGPVLAARGLRGPGDVASAVEAVQQPGKTGLSEREIFALGLGITWGARCWDT